MSWREFFEELCAIIKRPALWVGVVIGIIVGVFWL